jgi:hypothetical protein
VDAHGRRRRTLVLGITLALLVIAFSPVAHAQATSGTWTSTNSLHVARERFAATLIKDGRFLVVGGLNSGVNLASAELYDEATGSWRMTGPMSTPRYAPSATLLQDGTVLVAGGYRDGVGALATTEHYEPTTERWVAEADMPSAHTSHATAALPDGRALVVGGRGGSGTSASTETLLQQGSRR